MKFTPEHLASLKQAVIKSIAAKGKSFPVIKQEYQSAGLSDKRLVWDLFHFSKWGSTNWEESKDYYDTHIETAMKAIVKELA